MNEYIQVLDDNQAGQVKIKDLTRKGHKTEFLL